MSCGVMRFPKLHDLRPGDRCRVVVGPLQGRTGRVAHFLAEAPCIVVVEQDRGGMLWIAFDQLQRIAPAADVAGRVQDGRIVP